jgi:putative multiple sugar transport system substrate-binding protein
MVDAIMNHDEPPVNDTVTFDNGVKIVPTFSCKAQVVDIDNYRELLIDSGFYTAGELE